MKWNFNGGQERAETETHCEVGHREESVMKEGLGYGVPSFILQQQT